MAAGNIDILLTARDQYSRELETMKQRVRSAQKSVNEGAGGGGAAAALATRFIGATAAAAALERVVLGVVDALRKAQEEGKGLRETLADAAGGFRETVERLPLFGTAFKLGQYIRAEIDGTAAEIRRLTASMRESEQVMASWDQRIAKGRAARAAFERDMPTVMERTQEALLIEGTPLADKLGTQGFDRRREQLELEYRKALKQVKDIGGNARTDEQRQEVVQLRQHVEELYSIRRDALRKEQSDAIVAMQEEKREDERRYRERLERAQANADRLEETRRTHMAQETISRHERNRGIVEGARLEAFESRLLRNVPSSARQSDATLLSIDQGIKRMTGLLQRIQQDMPEVDVIG